MAQGVYGHIFFLLYVNYFYAECDKNIFIIANMSAVIHLASCQGRFVLEQQLFHNTGLAQTKGPLCESYGVKHLLHNTGCLQRCLCVRVIE